MKIFQSIQKCFAVLGIEPPQFVQNHSFNLNNVLTFVILVQVIISNNVYLFRGAANFKDFTNAFYWATTLTVAGVNFTIIFWKMMKMFDFIANLEKIIRKRLANTSSKTIYETANHQVEKRSEKIIFVLKKVALPCFMFPPCFISYFLYFTTDLANDAFQLPSPMW